MDKDDNNVSAEGGSDLFNDASRLHVVQARFEGSELMSFEDLFRGHTSLKALTYSNSVSLINRAAGLIDDIEIVFGREDILHDIGKWMHYQELLIKEILETTKGKSADLLRAKIDEGRLRLFVVKDMISHEKLFLLDGPAGKRVLTGSANFSERAFSGSQNESYVCFDDDLAAWDYFGTKFDKIKSTSAAKISRHAVLADSFDVANLPVFEPAKKGPDTPQILIVHDRPPEPTVINKFLQQKTPKAYAEISNVLQNVKGAVRIDKATAIRAVQYVKGNSRTTDNNPEEFLSIYPETGQVILSGKEISLQPAGAEVQNDAQAWIEYFDGFKRFRGNTERLARDYFTFMSWLYVSPLMCDFRNRSLAMDDYIYDYPLFGILYGKSNCGKSELVRTLLISMFNHEGFLDRDWFTKTQVAALREQNRRFPMVFDDLDNRRFTDHAIALIKDDYVSLKEYPPVVLSMNADRDTFETEVRKRCLIVYTDASLPDHTGESRTLARRVKKLKSRIGNALYREYLRRLLRETRSQAPQDVIELSSKVLVGVFEEHANGPLPFWCRVTSMNKYSEEKHFKIKQELLELYKYNPKAWKMTANKVTLHLDVQSVKKMTKDIPDYMVSGSRGDTIIFHKDYLEEFLDLSMSHGKFLNWLRRG